MPRGQRGQAEDQPVPRPGGRTVPGVFEDAKRPMCQETDVAGVE